MRITWGIFRRHSCAETTCQIGSLSLTIIDTAGLENELGDPQDTIGQAAQEKTTEILEQADIVLLVLDSSQSNKQIDTRFSEKIVGKRIITILNKSDLSSRLDTDRLPENLSNSVRISAKEGSGIEKLKYKIQQISGVTHFDPQQPICFTTRQENLLEQLINTLSAQQATSNLTKLLEDQIF